MDESLSETGKLLARIVRALVDHPEEVEVSEVRGSSCTMLEVRIAPEDMGKLIGRRGRTAKALRELLKDIGGKVGRRYALEIIEP